MRPSDEGWSVGPEVPRGPGAAIQVAKNTVVRLQQLGVKVPAGNRLEAAAKLLERINTDPDLLKTADDDLLSRIAEAQRTIIELSLIVQVSGGPNRTTSKYHTDKLEQILSGATTASGDRNPIARNTQAELYTAAVMTARDLTVTHGEPDLRLKYIRGGDVGIAVKRIGSISQLDKRVKQGIKQIKSAGGKGFVALNVDLLVEGIELSTEEEGRGAQFHQAVTAVHDAYEKHGDDPAFLGLLVFGYLPRWEDEDGKRVLGMHQFRQILGVVQDDDEENEFKEFFGNFERRFAERLQNL